MNNFSEHSSSDSGQRKYDHVPWVNKYLDLADTALDQKKDDRGPAA